MIEKIKVVTNEEMARIEKSGDPEAFMQKAGREIARVVIHYIKEHKLEKKVTILAGKGNNGGDAYCAGVCLLNAGITVQALSFARPTSSLAKKFEALFRKKGGKAAQKTEGVILDGLFGTGLKGPIEEKASKIIQDANRSGLPIISIDIPSGLNGTTGMVEDIAIHATETIALGLPKIGFFLNAGWNHIGRLHVVDFGLSEKAVESAASIAFLPSRLHLPAYARNQHKYQSGYVIGFSGSKKLPGAAKLAGLAALRSGAGIVKIFSPDDIGSAPLELICDCWSEKEWKIALSKANAVFVGPGLGNQKMWLKKHLKKIKLPCVIDADALAADLEFPKDAILTPHKGEMLRLLKCKSVLSDQELLSKTVEFCRKNGVIVVLKGAPSAIISPDGEIVLVPRGDPGMATAGSGDVLTGMISALLAQGLERYESAILGTALHAISGEYAARSKTSYCLIATDLIDFLPNAFGFAATHNIV